MRLSTDNYLWKIAFDVAERSTCDRFKAGCVVARNGMILSTGYNGSPDKWEHCDEAGHDLISVFKGNVVTEHCQRTIHAEINAIINAASNGINIYNCDWYVNGVCCSNCIKAISRLNPNSLFMCIDSYVQYSEFIWGGYFPYTKIVLKTKLELKEMGVII